LLLLSTVGLGGDGDLSKVLEGVFLSFTDLLHLSLLGLGLGNWWDDILLSNHGNGDSSVIILVVSSLLSDGGSHVDGVGSGFVEVKGELSGDVSGHPSISVLLWPVLFPGVLESETGLLSELVLFLLWVLGHTDWGDLDLLALWGKGSVEGAWEGGSVWNTLNLSNPDLSLGLASTLDVGRGDGELKSSGGSDTGQSAEWEFNGSTGINSSLEFLSEEGNLDSDPGVVAGNGDNTKGGLGLSGLSIVLELSLSKLGMGGDEERSTELLGQRHTQSGWDFLGEFREHDHLLGGGGVLLEGLGNLLLDSHGNIGQSFLVDLDNILDIVEKANVQESLEVGGITVLDEGVEVDEGDRDFIGDEWQSLLSKADLALGVEVAWEETGIGAELGITLEVLNVQITDLTGLVVVGGAQGLGTNLVDLLNNLTGILLHVVVLFGDWVLHAGNVDDGGGGIGTDFMIRVGVAQAGNKFPLSFLSILALNQEGQGSHTDLALAVDVGDDLGQEWEDRVLDKAGADGFLGSIKVVDQVLKGEDGVNLDDGWGIGLTNDLLDLGEDGGVANVSKSVQDDDGAFANILGGGLGQSLLKLLQEDGEESGFDNIGVTEATVDLNWVLDTLDFPVHTSLVEEVGQAEDSWVEADGVLTKVLGHVEDLLEELLGWVLDVFGEGSQKLDLLGGAQPVPVGGDQLGGLEDGWVGSGDEQALEVEVEGDLSGDLVLDLFNLLLSLLDDGARSKTEKLDGSGHLVHELTGVNWGGNGVGSTEGGGGILKKVSVQLWDFLGGDWGQEEFMKTGFV
jgi:hypothetical protein